EIGGAYGGIGDVGNADGHEPLLDGCSDGKLLLVAAVGLLGLHQLCVLHQRGRLGGDGAQDVMADGGDVPGGKTAVKIEHAADIARLGCAARVRPVLHRTAAQGDANDGAQVVGDDAVAARQFTGRASVRNNELGGSVGGVFQNGARNRRLVAQRLAPGVAASGHTHLSIRATQED